MQTMANERSLNHPRRRHQINPCRAVVTGVAARPNPIALVEERKQREPETNRGRRRGRVPGRARGRGSPVRGGGVERGGDGVEPERWRGCGWRRGRKRGSEGGGARASEPDLERNGWTGCSATPRVLRLPGFRMAPLFIRARAAVGRRVVGGKGRARTLLLRTCSFF